MPIVDLTQIKFQPHTACSKYSYPIRDVKKLLKNPYFDSSKKLVIMVNGWTQTVNDTIDKMVKVFNCHDDVNFLVSLVNLQA